MDPNRDTSQLVKLFVYGTLKRNEPRNAILLDPYGLPPATFLGEAVVFDFGLRSVGHRFPALIPKAEEQVVGELWEVDSRVLDYVLDAIEGVSFGLYRRIAITTMLLATANAEPIVAIAYEFLRPEGDDGFPLLPGWFATWNGRAEEQKFLEQEAERKQLQLEDVTALFKAEKTVKQQAKRKSKKSKKSRKPAKKSLTKRRKPATL